MKTNLYVDDLRPKPGVGWLLARTIKDAKWALDNCDEIITISLDYNMDQDEDNGITTMELLDYIKENNIWPVKGFIIHTFNSFGRKKMIDFINQYSPVPILEIKYY